VKLLLEKLIVPVLVAVATEIVKEVTKREK
jgi:hypothetical protein